MIAIADTHAFVWYLAADKRLSENARHFIEGVVEANESIGYVSSSEWNPFDYYQASELRTYKQISRNIL